MSGRFATANNATSPGLVAQNYGATAGGERSKQIYFLFPTGESMSWHQLKQDWIAWRNGGPVPFCLQTVLLAPQIVQLTQQNAQLTLQNAQLTLHNQVDAQQILLLNQQIAQLTLQHEADTTQILQLTEEKNKLEAKEAKPKEEKQEAVAEVLAALDRVREQFLQSQK